MNILLIYNSPLILTIVEFFKSSHTQHVYLPHQPQHLTLAHAAASVTITAINNTHTTKQWPELPTIPLLSRVQPPPIAYGTNDVMNNTTELLARGMAYDLLPIDTPPIIVYDSTVVYIQHLALIGTIYTNRQRIRTVFSAIS